MRTVEHRTQVGDDPEGYGQLDALLERSAALHGHLCPRQVLGVRIGLYAGELLGLELPQADKRALTFVETDGCFADGVSAATGCWLGRRTLRLVDQGKVAATVVDTQRGRAVRIWPTPDARDRAGHYAPAAASRWQQYLEGYRAMPASQLLRARDVDLTFSLGRLLSRPGARTVCPVCGEEIINEREVMVPGGFVCRSCAGDSYYR